MSSDKKQFLDPISTVGRIILLYFSKPKTKIRIFDHAVQLVENTSNGTESHNDLTSQFSKSVSSFYSSMSRTIYGDSRADISVLYPIFVRYIELYLVHKHNELETHKKTLEKQKKHEENDGSLDDESPSNNSSDNSSDNSSTKKKSSDEDLSSITEKLLCYNYLKKLGGYTITGIKELQKTYGQDNATFALQYYICLLTSGINQEYNEKILPDELKNMTKHNLLDNTKIQKLWDNAHIIELGKTFERCFKAKQNNDEAILDANIIKIKNLLDKHDEKFRKMIGTDQ